MPVQDVPAPEASKKRTSSDVQTEFNNLAFRAGHLQKAIYSQDKELKMYNETLDTLQVEYNTLKQQEDAVAKALAVATPASAAPEGALNDLATS